MNPANMLLLCQTTVKFLQAHALQTSYSGVSGTHPEILMKLELANSLFHVIENAQGPLKSCGDLPLALTGF